MNVLASRVLQIDLSPIAKRPSFQAEIDTSSSFIVFPLAPLLP